ncbi:MAG: bifunctional UDP-N-acetylmuramoyl-tripeptide:D-alanyl-D-alanine ligase/alanine racemase [Paludibacteraceae bacterium]
MKLEQIIKLLNQNIKEIPDVDIRWLLTDSRSLSFPAETLFFALKTDRNDGHKYITELYRRQLRYFVISQDIQDKADMPDAIFIRVEDTLQALQAVASVHRAQFDIPVVGITGSNGKTVVKEWLNQLLHEDFRIVRSPRSYNSQIGVPLSVWGINKNTQLGVFEAGISQKNEMEQLQPIINPTIGIFTNLGEAHQEGFAGQKQKAEEKLKLFKDSEVLIFNSDDKLLEIAVRQANLKAKLFSWGQKPGNCLQVIHIKKNGNTTLELLFEKKSFPIEIPFSDEASIENALQCVCLMLYMDYSFEKIAEKILKLEPIAMRLEVKEGNNGCLIINDTYNSDFNSLGIALDFQNRQTEQKKLNGTLILSDILQSGQSSDVLYERVSQLIEQKNIGKLIGIGDQITQSATKFKTEEKYFFSSTNEFLKSPLMYEFRNEIILLKGARSFSFEQILARLAYQVHETTLDVDLNAFLANFNYFRAQLRPETKTMCMVKAFAYGSGSVEIARTLQNNRCDYLAVAVADEGAELRREGIRVPIVVMNPEKGAFDTILEHKLEPEIYSFRLLESFIQSVEKWAVTDYPIHLKIDSGMHRLGFDTKDIPMLVERLKNQNQIKIRSVFTHLAGSDSRHFDTFTREQVGIFTRCSDEISQAFPHTIMRHVLNSAGVERFPEYQFDMVRLGIGLYSISAVEQVKLQPVCTLKTVILQIKDVEAGETVGYSRKGKISRNSRIGVIPIGYADGFDRRLGNGVGDVLINGNRAKVVGNVCMDLCMIDLTDIPASEGDEVEIFGKNIPIEEIAEKLQTIPYEVLTGVSKRVKRVYFMD